MADNQAMGAALYTLGQGVSGASDAYFGGQIKAAQTAQEVALKTMQMKAEQEQKQAALNETTRYHTADLAQKATAEGDRRQEAADKLKQTGLYQEGELGLRSKEVGLRGQEVANTASHNKVMEQQGEEKIAIDRTKASKTGKDATATSLSKGLTIANRDVKDAQEAMKAVLPAGVDPGTLSGPMKEAYTKAQARLNDAMQKRSVLTRQLQELGALEPPPLGDPGASEQDKIDSGTNFDVAPYKQPAPVKNPATGKPVTAKAAGAPPFDAGPYDGKVVTSPDGKSKFRSVNGQWVPFNG